MTKVVVVCLGVLVWCSAARASEPFELANSHGNPNKLSFFFFSTSVGKYVIRHDGMGELHTRAGRKHVFYLLKLGAKVRIERIYFLQHEGDLFLFYETHSVSFLMRMDQQRKKPRWWAPITSRGAPVIEGGYVIIDDRQINKTDGKLSERDVLYVFYRRFNQLLERRQVNVREALDVETRFAEAVLT